MSGVLWQESVPYPVTLAGLFLHRLILGSIILEYVMIAYRGKEGFQVIYLLEAERQIMNTHKTLLT